MLAKLFPQSEERAEREASKQIDRELKRESNIIGKMLVNKLTRLGFDHYVRKAQQTGTVSQARGNHNHQKVKFLVRRSDETTHYFKIDVEKLPYLVKSLDFIEDYVAKELSITVGLPVSVVWNARKGLAIVVTREGSLAGIPVEVPYLAALEQMKQSDAELTFVLGMTEGQTWLRYNLADAPHLLVAGSSNEGKSVFMNQMLLTFLRRLSPLELKLYLIDLKEGIELSMFEKFPHVDQFVTEPEDAGPAVRQLLTEMKRRGKQLKGKAKNITGWNRQHKGQPDQIWPRILLVIDEYAQLRFMHQKEALEDLNMVLAKGRAVGIHVVLCTQTPNRDVVNPAIKNNIGVRLAFRCASNAHSINIIDTGAAFGLDVRGRFIFSNHGKLTQVQAPYLKDDEADKMIKELLGINRPLDRFNFDLLLEYSIDNLAGELAVRPLKAEFKQQVSGHAIEAYLKRIDRQVVSVHGKNYLVLPGDNNNSRRLMAILPEELRIASRVPRPTESVLKGE